MEARQGSTSAAGNGNSPFGDQQEIALKARREAAVAEAWGWPVLTQRQDSVQCDELSDVQEGGHGLYGHLAQRRPQVAVLTWGGREHGGVNGETSLV